MVINLPEDSTYSNEEVKLFFDQINFDKWMTFLYVLDIKSMQKDSLEENKKLPTTVIMNYWSINTKIQKLVIP